MICNTLGIALIKQFESCKREAYLDGAGVPTIGWGHTGPEVHLGLIWPQQQVDDVFLTDLMQFEQGVTLAVKKTVGANQFAALVSLAFNIGLENFAVSTVLHLINAELLAQVPSAFAMWDKITNPVTGELEVSEGLVARRMAEARLFNTPDAS